MQRFRVAFPVGPSKTGIVDVANMEHAWTVVQNRSVTRAGVFYREVLLKNGKWRKRGAFIPVGVPK